MVTHISPTLVNFQIDGIVLTCEKGHNTSAYRIVALNPKTGEYESFGGSAWDFCEEGDCSWRSEVSREAGYAIVQQKIKEFVEANSLYNQS